MYKIGITGSIGTGKTTLANMFALFRIPVFDADKEIKKILNNKEVMQKLNIIFPNIIKKNNIDKPKLKTIIFSDKNKKKKLENLLYPYLEIEKSKFINVNFKKKILVYDVPLIYETKSENQYDLILLTNCNKNIQKARVLKRDKITSSLFESIIKSQLSFSEKIRFKPKLINTNNLKIFTLIKVILLLIRILIKLKIKDGTKKKINT